MKVDKNIAPTIDCHVDHVRAFYECQVAEDVGNRGKLVGFVLYFWTYSTWEGKAVYMEDLYVSPGNIFAAWV